MSSRPLGWCIKGADKMARLRVYRQNKGNVLELVDMPIYSIPFPQIKKIVAIKNHIWGLKQKIKAVK